MTDINTVIDAIATHANASANIFLKVGKKTFELTPEQATALSDGKAEAFDALRKQEDAKGDFKTTVDTIAVDSGLPKGLITKYLKARFQDKTQEAKEVGAAFDALDKAVA